MASSISCVTKTTVFLCVVQREDTSSCSSKRSFGSIAPKGSSKSSTSDSSASARATATLCFIPPLNWLGYLSLAAASPTLRRYSSAFSSRSFFEYFFPLCLMPNRIFPFAVSHGKSEYCWKTTARSGPGPAIGFPSNKILPDFALFKPFRSPKRVDLPHPEEPKIQMNSPSLIERLI